MTKNLSAFKPHYKHLKDQEHALFKDGSPLFTLNHVQIKKERKKFKRTEYMNRITLHKSMNT